MKKLLFPLFLSLLAMPTANASAPLSFTYHGVLREHETLVNSTRNITAEVLDEDNNIAGSYSGSVNIDAGQYSMTIAIDDTNIVINAEKLFLKISIDGTELGKLPINSVPYAISSFQADTAHDVNCNGCITPENLSFVPNLEGFEIPSCGAHQIMRSDGNKYVCTDALTINDDVKDNMITQIQGNIGINAGNNFDSFAITKYVLDSKNEVNKPEGLGPCYCDKDEKTVDCPEGFTLPKDNDIVSSCYDSFDVGGSLFYRTYKLQNDIMHAPIDNLMVIKNSQVGIGTGLPQAPLHIRSDKGDTGNDVVISDTQPSIKLESLDGKNSYKIIVDDNGLSIVNTNTGKRIVIDDGNLKLDRDITTWAARGNIKARGKFTTNCSCSTRTNCKCNCPYNNESCSSYCSNTDNLTCDFTCSRTANDNLTDAVNVAFSSRATGSTIIKFNTPIINPGVSGTQPSNLSSTEITFSHPNYFTTSKGTPSGCGQSIDFIVYGED